MDNNNDNIASDMQLMMQAAQNIINKIESRCAFKDIPAEQKEDLEKELLKNGVPEKIEELKKRLADYNNLTSTVNGTAH